MIKILSYLKRIIGNRDQLKSIFFHSRYKFITDEFDTLLPFKQSRLIEKYLKRTLEIFREFCFQTVITFDSVFDRDRHLTYVFLRSLTDRLCAILVENLPLLAEDSACDSLLLQLIYCCQSLSRVGGDLPLPSSASYSPPSTSAAFSPLSGSRRSLSAASIVSSTPPYSLCTYLMYLLPSQRRKRPPATPRLAAFAGQEQQQQQQPPAALVPPASTGLAVTRNPFSAVSCSVGSTPFFLNRPSSSNCRLVAHSQTQTHESQEYGG